MEFLESHTTDKDIKSIWKNDIDISGPLSPGDNKLEENENGEEKEEEKKSKLKEKIADKGISDLEVCCSFTILEL